MKIKLKPSETCVALPDQNEKKSKRFFKHKSY